jgi:protease-3
VSTPDPHVLYSTTPKKAPTDTRQYKYLILSNQMKVLLISDPDSTQAGCVAAVNVGSYYDSNSALGFTHAL